jgi:hypothetical protein
MSPLYDFEKENLNTLSETPNIPIEWVKLINQLHPITAIIVWQVLTNSLSPASIKLAQYSPDWDKYIAVQIVGGGNPEILGEITRLARPEIDSIFQTLSTEFSSSHFIQ